MKVLFALLALVAAVPAFAMGRPGAKQGSTGPRSDLLPIHYLSSAEVSVWRALGTRILTLSGNGAASLATFLTADGSHRELWRGDNKRLVEELGGRGVAESMTLGGVTAIRRQGSTVVELLGDKASAAADQLEAAGTHRRLSPQESGIPARVNHVVMREVARPFLSR